jgi:hypothetical protein
VSKPEFLYMIDIEAPRPNRSICGKLCCPKAAYEAQKIN